VSAPNGAQYLFASGNNLFVYTSAGVYEMRGGDTSWTLMNGTGLPSTYSSNAFSLVGTKMFMTGLDNSVPLHSTTHVWKRDIGEITGVHEIPARIPDRFSLQQNYPNPFNPTTHFQFSIAGEQLVGLKVFDVLGREVATVVNEVKQPGRYEVEWNASGIPSGMYFYRLQAGKLSDVRKLLLMK
jgi:hypothetical protein